MRVPIIERQIGITAFATKTRGIGGVIKKTPDDFHVEEVLVDGSQAAIGATMRSQVPGEGRYLHCIIVKRGWDTLLALKEIAKQLGITTQRIQIVGLKDKHAITAQHASIENFKAEMVNTRYNQTENLRVIPHHYSQNMLFPHMLFGNSFKITIRNVTHNTAMTDERISATMNHLLSLGGVPNFFGHQRFGTIRSITHLVGKAIVQNDLRRAVHEFVTTPSLHEHPKARKAREQLHETGNYENALHAFPRWLHYERLILSHLITNPNDYPGALRQLPRQLCRLFVQGYQSYLFNRFLSLRLSNEIPLNQPQIGDFVVRVDSHDLPTRTYVQTDESNRRDLERDVKHRKMCVALPLIGYKQHLSEGVEGAIEESILQEEKTRPVDFSISSLPELSSAGRLRGAITPILSFHREEPTRDNSVSSRRKIQIRFTLHRGSYATIVLRELMKPRSLIKAGF